MSRMIGIVVGGLLLAGTLAAETAPAEAELERLVVEFLAGASRSDVAAHERFWDEELIYTSSSGKRFGKAEILGELEAGAFSPPELPTTVYTAEELRVLLHGTTAVIAFRLVGTTADGGTTTIESYLNTGTFVKRADGWRAVAWQATRIPTQEKRSAEVVFHPSPHAAHADIPFSEAVRAGDFLFLAGMIGNVAGERRVVPGGIRPEARQVMENVRAAAARHGAKMSDLVKCTVILADIADWPAFNEVYREYFADRFPARSAFAAAGLALGARVEVECVGYLTEE